jgi:hypothetical protein
VNSESGGPGSSPPPPDGYGSPGGTPPENPPPYTPPPYAPPSQIPPPYAPPEAGSPWAAQTSLGDQPPGSWGPGAQPYAPARQGPNRKLMAAIAGGVAVVVVIVVVVIVVAGGSGNSPTSTVNGFISALLSNNGSAVCSYFPPADQSGCNANSSEFSGASGHGQAVAQVIQGDDALVSITGELCAPFVPASSDGSHCSSNSSASAGMPGNGVSFAQAFASATSSSNNSLSPVALAQINGKWYLDIGS